MTPEIREAMVVLSDVSFVLLAAGLNVLAAYAWAARHRNGDVLRRLAEFLLAIAVVYDYLGLIYMDRRWDVLANVDAQILTNLEWAWVPRLFMLGATARLLWTLMTTEARRRGRGDRRQGP